MIRGTTVQLKGGHDKGCVMITSVTRAHGKICMVLWNSPYGDLRYSWEREEDLSVVEKCYHAHH